MKKTKLLACMFTICLSACLSLGFSACQDFSGSLASQSSEKSSVISSSAESSTGSSVESSTDSSVESSTDNSESSNLENSESSNLESDESSNLESDESSSIDSSVDTPPSTTEVLTLEQWQTAFSPQTFSNYTMEGTGTSEDASSWYATAHHTTNALHVYADGMDIYYSLEDGKTYAYMDMTGTGSFSKMDVSETGFTLADISPASDILIFSSYYNSFAYNSEKNVYTAEDIVVNETLSYTDVCITFKDGKVADISFVSILTEEGDTYTSENVYTFSNYGTTMITLPVIESTPDQVGDGKISQNEWEKALTPSAFTNVKQDTYYTYSNLNEDPELTLKDTIYWDDSDVAKIYGLITIENEAGVSSTIISTQYWLKSGEAYVQHPFTLEDVAYEYIYLPDLNTAETSWQAAKESILAICEFQSFYSLLVWDGLTGTMSSEELFISFTFNEQEQLIEYSFTTVFEDGTSSTHIVYYSQYGQIKNTPPTTGIYYPPVSEEEAA